MSQANQDLATRIVDRLIQEQLIPDGSREEVIRLLSGQRVRADDWTQIVTKAIDEEARKSGK